MILKPIRFYTFHTYAYASCVKFARFVRRSSFGWCILRRAPTKPRPRQGVARGKPPPRQAPAAYDRARTTPPPQLSAPPAVLPVPAALWPPVGPPGGEVTARTGATCCRQRTLEGAMRWTRGAHHRRGQAREIEGGMPMMNER